MANYYIYLIASLPTLTFGTKAPLTNERFLGVCQGQIPEKEVEFLEKIFKKDESLYESPQPTLRRWLAFDTALRNELVKIRASRRHVSAIKYLRQDKYEDPSVAHVAMSAHRNPSILEAERILDQERWRMLDELKAGHYFDLDVLVIYALKLSLLERWERIQRADKPKLLEESLSASREQGD